MELEVKIFSEQIINHKFEERIAYLNDKIEKDFNRLNQMKSELYDKVDLVNNEFNIKYPESAKKTFYRYNSMDKFVPKKNGIDDIVSKEKPSSSKQKLTNSKQVDEKIISKFLNNTQKSFKKRNNSVCSVPESLIIQSNKAKKNSLNDSKSVFFHQNEKLRKSSISPIKNTSKGNNGIRIFKNINNKVNISNQIQENLKKHTAFSSKKFINKSKNSMNLEAKIPENTSVINGAFKKIIKSNAPFENKNLERNLKFLGILTTSNFLELKKSLYINLYCKPLFVLFEETKFLILKKEALELIKITNILYVLLKYFLDDPKLSKLISIPYFIPSKTAQNSLNFITKKHTISLINETNPNVIALFKIIYIIINQNYDEYEENEIIKNLFEKIMPNNNISSLKSLFVKYFMKNLSLSQAQIDCVNNIILLNPKVLNPTYVLRINHSASLITFIIREIYEYACLMNEDGQSLMKSRKLYFKYLDLKKKLSNIKSIIGEK